MYLPYKHFKALAEKILKEYPVTISNRKNKWGGRDVTATIKSESRKSLQEKYTNGKELEYHSWTSGENRDEETARNILRSHLANGLQIRYNFDNQQLYSDKIKYYSEHKEDLFKEEDRGSTDEYLQAIFAPEKYEGKADFKEHFYLAKDAAKQDWLSTNNYSVYRDMILSKRPPVFMWDEESFPKYALKPKSEEKTIEAQNKPAEISIDKSKDTGNIKLGYRPEFLNSPILYGRERVLILANGEKHKAQYAIVELDNILASHDEYSFNDTPDYPVNARGENINDRNYAQDKNAQAKVIEIAQNFEPETQVSTSASAAGLPVVTIDGIVVSGNNRTMSFKRMVKEFPENYAKYLKTLSREISTFGIDQSLGYSVIIYKEPIVDNRQRGETFRDNKYIKFVNPILVRIDYDFPAYNTTEMNKYNKDTKKSERPIDRAIKLSSMLLDNERCFNVIAEIVGQFETLSDLYSTPVSIGQLKKHFVDCNILTQQELPAFFTDNSFNAQGKEFFMNLLAGMILDKNALLSSEMDGVKKLKEKIVTALPVLIKNSKLSEGSLIADINQAVLLQQKMVSTGMSLSDYIRSPKLFSEAEENFSRKAYYLNELLNMSKHVFKQSIEAYNNGVLSNSGESLFGDKLTPDQIFKSLIVAKVDAGISATIEQFYAPETVVEVDNEKEKARARSRSKIKILKLKAARKNAGAKIMAKGGNVGCKQGCPVDGKTHDEGGELVELEKNEAVIMADAVQSERTYTFEGKQMEPKEILNILNTSHGGNPIK